ncbi:MAG: alpha/beta fold hydrolase [Lachnospiraceae bacterium]
MKEFYIDSDGIRLHAKLDTPEGFEKGPLCILFHGFTGHMEEDHLVALQKAINNSGIAVLRAEMYGHGKSEGKFSEHTLYKWVTNALSVVKYARSSDFVTDLYLCGHSQGGLLTMLVGGMCQDVFKAILPISPAWMIPDGARSGHLLNIDFDPVNIPDKIIGWDRELSGDYIRVAQTIHVEDEINRYTGPVLIVHGTADDAVPFSYGEKASKLYQNATLIPIKDAGHCFNDHLQELSDAVSEFFKTV